MNRLEQLHDAGVSIWLDTLSRELLATGAFADLIAGSAVTGATSNPTIFAKAIISSDRYDEQLRAAVLPQQLPAAAARHQRFAVPVDAGHRHQAPATAGVQVRDHAALGTEPYPVCRVLDVAPDHEPAVVEGLVARLGQTLVARERQRNISGYAQRVKERREADR